MSKAVDDFIEALEPELQVGGGATLDELFNLALAIKSDLDELTTNTNITGGSDE